MVDLGTTSFNQDVNSVSPFSNSSHDFIRYAVPLCVTMHCDREGWSDSSFINRGKSSEFADTVVELVKASIDVVIDKMDSSQLLEYCGQECQWDRKVMENLGARTENWGAANLIAPYTHCWVHYQGIHYDAECTEGTVNPFDLPFFKRSIAAMCKFGNQ